MFRDAHVRDWHACFRISGHETGETHEGATLTENKLRLTVRKWEKMTSDTYSACMCVAHLNSVRLGLQGHVLSALVCAVSGLSVWQTILLFSIFYFYIVAWLWAFGSSLLVKFEMGKIKLNRGKVSVVQSTTKSSRRKGRAKGDAPARGHCLMWN